MLTAESLARRLEVLNQPIPKAIETVTEIRRAINSAATDDPTGALIADLLAGDVTPKQAATRVKAAATALTEREKARQVAVDLEPTLERLARRAARDEGEAILTSLRPGFDQAVAVIADATATFGTIADEATVLNLGPGAIAAWEQRQQAVRVLTEVRRLCTILAEAGYGTTPIPASAWLAEAPDVTYLDQANRDIRGIGEAAVNLAMKGYKLRLNTPDEAAQIAANAHLATEEADAAAREAAQAEGRAKLDARHAEMTEAIKAAAARNAALEHLGGKILEDAIAANHPGLRK